MLITILAWIYITFISYSWGKILLKIAAGKLHLHTTDHIHPTVICFTGLVLIAAIASAISFVLPLSLWSIQLIFLLPAFFSCKWLFTKVKLKQLNWTRINISLLVCCTVTVLVMSTYTISHPDSLGYHIPVIKWIEEYKVVPGIANLNARLGFQSSWFILCALFNFKFTGVTNYAYLNSAVTLWVIFFVLSKINKSILQKKYKESWLWIGFILLTLGSYTQIPLTATSSSPDYIAAIYIWLVLYILYNTPKHIDKTFLTLIIAFSFFAFSIKFSTLPIIAAGIYALIKILCIKEYKAFFLSTSLAAIIVLCLLSRNAITSGYILYPSAFPNIINTDWKVPEKKVLRESAYIKAFARIEAGASNDAIEHANSMKIQQWMPVWWAKRNLADRIILILAGLSCLILLFSYRKLLNSHALIPFCILIVATGLLFWFWMGPDPRFGFGFIMGVIALALHISIDQKVFGSINQKLIFFTLVTLNVAILGYTSYRFNKYFSVQQLVKSNGVKVEPAYLIKCEGVDFYLAPPFKGCGINPIPCIEDSCKSFSMRGDSISQGFKPKTN